MQQNWIVWGTSQMPLLLENAGGRCLGLGMLVPCGLFSLCLRGLPWPHPSSPTPVHSSFCNRRLLHSGQFLTAWNLGQQETVRTWNTLGNSSCTVPASVPQLWLERPHDHCHLYNSCWVNKFGSQPVRKDSGRWQDEGKELSNNRTCLELLWDPEEKLEKRRGARGQTSLLKMRRTPCSPWWTGLQE